MAPRVELSPKCVVLALGFCWLPSVWLSGQELALDPGFGVSGVAEVFVHDAGFHPRKILVLNDGRILVGGTLGSQSEEDVAVLCLLPNGEKDTAYGDEGLVRIELPPYSFGFKDMLVLESGELLLLYGLVGSGYVLRRLDVSGSLDTDYGDSGIVAVDFEGHFIYPMRLVLQPDGMVAVLGYEGMDLDPWSYWCTMIRHDADGILDPDFADNGILRFDLGYDQQFPIKACTQSDGGTVIACKSNMDADNGSSIITKFDGQGSVDPTFGDEGQVILPFPDYESPHPTDLLIDQLDRVWIYGGLQFGQAFVLRLSPNGDMDSTFNMTGMLTLDCDGSSSFAQAPGDRILATAVRDQFSPQAACLVRLTENGGMDPTLSGDGIMDLYDYFYASSDGFPLHVYDDGRVLVSATPNGGLNASYCRVVRYYGDQYASVVELDQPCESPFPFPNPVHDAFRLKYVVKSPVNLSLRLLDQEGTEVWSLFEDRPHAPGVYEEDYALPDIPAGCYSIAIAGGNRTIATRLVVIGRF